MNDRGGIALRRLMHQQLAASALTSAAEAVAWMGAIQAQDWAGAKWSVGLRLPGSTDADVERSIAEAQIVRTWPMRGTLHFVSSKDVRWMLVLLTPRILDRAAGRHAQLRLDDGVFQRCGDLFAKALRGNKRRTRDEMYALLEDAGISASGQRGYHILGWAAQTGLICFGPPQGKQQTFVWLDDWVPRAEPLNRERALAEVAKRYFTSRGPATVQDFVWWSGLKSADARIAIELAGPELVEEDIGGARHWLCSRPSSTRETAGRALLLPGFDEFLLGYTDRSAVLDPSHAQRVCPGGNGMFKATVAVDGQIVGTWSRAIKKRELAISLQPFRKLSRAERNAIAGAAEQYGAFMQMDAVLSE